MVHCIKSCSPNNEERLSNFYTSSWQRCDSPIPMLVVRLVEFILTSSILVWCMVEASIDKLAIYLTTWGMLLIFAMAGSGVAVSICALKNMLPEVGKPPWYVRMYWTFFNISVSLAFIITLLYWRLLAKNISKYDIHQRYFWLETAVHGFNCVLVLLELFASRTPVRLGHIYQPVFFGLAYAVFSKIYQMCGGTNKDGDPYIYKFLDWSEPQFSFKYTMFTAIGLIFLYTVFCVVALIRDLLSYLCCTRSCTSSKRSKSDANLTEAELELGVSSVSRYNRYMKGYSGDPKIKTCTEGHIPI